jgi:hypothetical protein
MCLPWQDSDVIVEDTSVVLAEPASSNSDVPAPVLPKADAPDQEPEEGTGVPDDQEAAVDDEEAGVDDEEAEVDDEEAAVDDEEAEVDDEEAEVDDKKAAADEAGEVEVDDKKAAADEAGKVEVDDKKAAADKAGEVEAGGKDPPKKPTKQAKTKKVDLIKARVEFTKKWKHENSAMGCTLGFLHKLACEAWTDSDERKGLLAVYNTPERKRRRMS